MVSVTSIKNNIYLSQFHHPEVNTLTFLVDFFQFTFLGTCKLAFLSNHNLHESFNILKGNQK